MNKNDPLHLEMDTY